MPSKDEICNGQTPLEEVVEPNLTHNHSPVSELFSLAGKTILITGGGRGVGIVLAAAVVEAGGHVACIDLLPEPSVLEWATLKRSAKSRQLSLTYHRCDITDEPQLSKVIDEIAVQARGMGAPLLGAVACAGIQQTIPAIEYPAEAWRKILDVNVTGTFLTAKLCAQHFASQDHPASIVLVASMSGQIANRGLACSAYNTSKAAVQQMCRSLAQEWGKHKIRINSLSPGYIRTDMTDALLLKQPEVERTWMQGALLGRLGVPGDFKAPVIYLLADGSSFMTGADLRVDGGHCASA